MAGRLVLVLSAAVHLLGAAAAEDWVAYRHREQLGPPSQPGAGWLELELAQKFRLLDWEAQAGTVNGYRHYHPNATHYILGAGPELVEVWQPFGETPRDGTVGANIRGALYSLYHRNLSRYTVKLRNAGWAGVVSDWICREGSPCPNTMLIGDSQVPARVAARNARRLDDLFERHLETHMRRLADDFPPLAEYEYNFHGDWVGIPILTDLRLLRFNVTTLTQLGEGLPPPHGNLPWTWEKLGELACKIARRFGNGTGIFMSSDYDEDYKYAMMMAQSAGLYLFRKDELGNRRCGLREPAFADLVDHFWKRVLLQQCAAANDGGTLETYWAGASPPSPELEATLGALDPAHPPPQGALSRYITDAPLAGGWLQPYLPGFAFTTGVADRSLEYGRCSHGASCQWVAGGGSGFAFQACRQAAWDSEEANTFSFDAGGGRCTLKRCTPLFENVPPEQGVETFSVYCSDILYADMPGNVTYLGGSGLILPVPALPEDACPPSRRSGTAAPGAVSDCEAAEERRVAEGWRIMAELADRDKPWIMQMNTMKGGRTVPPIFSMMSNRPFTDEEWQPAVTALFHGIPSQYPNTPVPEAQSIEAVKPLRVALVRAVYGHGSTMSAIEDGCAVLEQLLRPCNQSAWESDPRCTNPLDDLQGCRAGQFFPEGQASLDGQSCQPCQAGTFRAERGVESACVACPPGRFAAGLGATRCELCGAGTAAALPGMSGCQLCEGGAVGAGHTGCSPCAQGQYLLGGVCEECPAGKSSKEGSRSERDCYLKPTVYIYTGLLFPLIFCLVSALPLALGVRIPIEDVCVEDGQAVVRTWGLHYVLKCPPALVQVKLRNTGHPALEGRFYAKFKSNRALWLVDKDGADIAAQVDASLGSVQVCFPHSLWCVGVRILPIGVVLAGLSLATGIALGMHPAALLGGRSLEITLLVLFAAAVAAWNAHQRGARFASTPLARRCREFRKRLHGIHPEPRPCPRGPGRAVTAGQLWDFYESFQDFIRLRNMYYVATDLLLPLTKPEQLSYAELVGPSQVQWFVSHYWGGAFKDLVSSLCKHAEGEGRMEWRSQAFWVCSFSNNQWQVQAELGSGDPLDSSFYLALRSEGCRGTAMVLDPLALPLTRSWCLFEVFQTFVISGQDQDFMGLLLCTPNGVLQNGGTGVDAAVAVAHKLATISLEDATATSLEDKRMIEECVRQMPGGFQSMNRFVRECIKRALQAVHRSFEYDFQTLVLALDQVPGQSADELAELCRTLTQDPPPRLLGRVAGGSGSPLGGALRGWTFPRPPKALQGTGGARAGWRARTHLGINHSIAGDPDSSSCGRGAAAGESGEVTPTPSGPGVPRSPPADWIPDV